MKKYFKIYLFCICSLAFETQAATTNAISQWGISWQFDQEHEYGTFVNGDYWVVGPLKITNMTPEWTGIHNGWEINPAVSIKQGFISNAFYNANLRPEIPFVVTNGSLVKVVSGTMIDGSLVGTAAVLTVLAQAPPNNGTNIFRPPYVGDNKVLYSVSQLKTELLPKYSMISNAPLLSKIVSNYTKCLRMDHNTNDARLYRPSFSMYGYQPNNTPTLNEAMLRLMLNDSERDKMEALIMFTQHSIDRAYAVYLGYRNPGSGHNPNQRVVAAWAAVMLDITEIKKVMSAAHGFHEDEYLYNGKNGPLWGQSGTEAGYWEYIIRGKGSRSIKDPYEFIDGGSLITGVASYQHITSQSLKGQALVYALFTNLQECIPSNRLSTLQGYAKRWVRHGTWSMPDPVAPYDGNTNNIGITYGPVGNGQYIKGLGRFPTSHGKYKDGGQYRSEFVGTMWETHGTKIFKDAPSATKIKSIKGF